MTKKLLRGQKKKEICTHVPSSMHDINLIGFTDSVATLILQVANMAVSTAAVLPDVLHF